MQTTRAFGRTTLVALTISTAAALGASNAAACDGNYEIEAGDTLGAIAAECDTTVDALARANGVDARALQLGQTLAIPGEQESVGVRDSARTRAEADPAEDAAGYRVGPGDTIGSIAAELGVPVDALVAANDRVNPRMLQIGQRLAVPGVDGVRAALAERQAERERVERMAVEYPNPTIALRKGDWRLTIDMKAEGLAPGEPVNVAIRGRGGDWVALGEIPADADGRLVARARIPGALAGARDLEVAIERPADGGVVTATYSQGGTITAGRSGDDVGTSVEVAGKVVRGGGCSLLVTRDGRTYALTGDTLGMGAGDQVLVKGAVEDRAEGCVGHEALRVGQASLLTKS